jgi:arylsulfatase A-like enzyme
MTNTQIHAGLSFLATTLLLASPAALRAAPADARPPDIIVLLADDLGNADVGWHGSDIRTPNLDRLAAGGAKLEQFYVLSVCTPTRVALLTGRYPIRSGMQMNVLRENSAYGLPLEERTIANALREAGYTTAICGKWHVGHFDRAYWPNARGFDHWYGHLQGINHFTHRSYTKSAEPDWYRNGEPVVEDGYATTLEAREAVALIRRQPAGKPLFLYVPFTGVHGPLQAPGPESAAGYRKTMNSQRADLAAMMTAVDDGCGQILAALDATGRRENTLIVFASDNGGLPPGRNLPYRAFKSSLYEGGVRSCAFAAWPGRIKPGTVVNEPLHIVDLFPTFVRLAGGSLAQKLPLDGRDIWPVLTEGSPTPHEDILINATPQEGALRKGDWKLVINGRDAVSETRDPATGERKKTDRAAGKDGPREHKVELFNLRDDPGEKKDIAAANPGIVKDLQTRYDAYAAAAAEPLQFQIKKGKASPGGGGKADQAGEGDER